MATLTREKKIPVEKLQEEYLQGPVDEPIEQTAAALQQDQVVIATKVPDHERVVFRNQRDPGHMLEFHYSSGTHPFKQYKLVDGKEYTLSREVIVNLESRRENIEKYRRNSEGLPEIYIAGYRTHFVCERVA